MEWQGPAVVLEVRPQGDADALVVLLTGDQGRHATIARGGGSRAQASLWQPGNLIEARWVGRLPEQLGAVTGEMLYAAAALAMEDALALDLLAAACAVAAGVLPERTPHPATFAGLAGLIARLGPDSAAEHARWEATLLAELGFGLDLGTCAVTGATTDLVWVSPRTGRAVSGAGGAAYADRLLPLPAFLRDGVGSASDLDALAGLRITGHFLRRDAFGATHRGLPAARDRLIERLESRSRGPLPPGERV